MTAPATRYTIGTPPFIIAEGDYGGTIVINPNTYTVTSEANCGSIDYSLHDDTLSSAVANGDATIASASDPTVTIGNLSSFAAGIFYLRLEVRTAAQTSSTAADYFTIAISTCIGPAINAQEIVHANTESLRTLSYTDFYSTGTSLDTASCLDGNEEWFAKGPATSNVAEAIAFSSWLYTSGTDLMVDIPDPSVVDFDGVYEITH